MTFITSIQEAIRLAELQVATLAENPAEAAAYTNAIEIFKNHLTWHPANHSGEYLAGVMAMLRTQLSGEDDALADAIGHTLGLVDDGAEWRLRLQTARQALIDAGVMV